MEFEVSSKESALKIENFIKNLVNNLKKEFNDETLLNKVLNIIKNTKNKTPKISEKKDVKKNEISKEIMVENLVKLIPKRELLDDQYSVNKVDEFVVLLDKYSNTSKFEFKALKLTISDMVNTLVWLIAKENLLNKNELFIKLLNIYDTYNFDINFQPKTGKFSYLKYTLLHWCIEHNNVSILNYLLSNYKDRIHFNVKSLYDGTIYDYSIKRGYYNIASSILVSSLGINLSNSIEKYCSNNNQINSVSKLFLYYLKKNCNMKNTLEMIIKILEKTMINLINNQKCFSKYLLKIIFDYNISKSNSNNGGILNVKNNRLWNVIKSKLKRVLNIDTLYKEKVDWFWFKNYILNSNIWLYKIDKNGTLLYNELLNIVKNELKKQENKLQQNIKLLVNKNRNIWDSICNFSYKNKKYKLHRQDMITNGITSSYHRYELNKMFINNDNTFNIYSLNDYNNYLSKLIILGHKLNNFFVSSIKNIFFDYINGEKCTFKSGPVKRLERCIVKSQLDYNKSKYPTSSCIIDIIRGSLTFNNLLDYYSGIKLLINCVNDKNDNTSITHKISDILRIKNGFNIKYKKYLKTKTKEEKKINIEDENDYFIPKSYLDIKINVIISHNNESIIGELQFLLKPMLDNKKENHELYEITRLKDIILHSNNKLENTNPTKELEIAISDKNKNKIAQILTFNNLNDININKIGIDEKKMPLFIQCIKKNSLCDLVFKYFKDKIDYTLSDAYKFNVLHYMSRHLKENNETNKNTINNLLNILIPSESVILNKQDQYGRTPIMTSIEYEDQFVFSLILSKLQSYPKLSMINFNLSDRDNNNIFHYLFKNCNFNNINLDLIMNRYKLFNKTNNIKHYKVLFNTTKNDETIFHLGFKHNFTFSLQIFKKLEYYLSINNTNVTLFKAIFKQEDYFKNTAFMYLIKENSQNLTLIKYLINKFNIKILKDRVIILVKLLNDKNPTKLWFKSMFSNLF